MTEAKYHELIYPLNLFGVFQFENLIKIHEQCKCRLLVCVCVWGGNWCQGGDEDETALICRMCHL